MKSFLAIDIGASSGRHIVGHRENGELVLTEVYRFPNGVQNSENGLVWDIDGLVENVKAGIAKAKEAFSDIESLAVDTWGVDYVLMNGDKAIKPCFAYRNDRTEKILDEFYSKLPFSELYAHTGIQHQSFNTVYQLYCDKVSGRLENATDFLMIPEYISYCLTDKKVKEYTNATTGALVNPDTLQYDTYITEKLGLKASLFGKLEMPGYYLGDYEGIKVVMCASHDTASAVEAIPMEHDLFISSGTWSLLGAKLEKAVISEKSLKANYTNEGGVGYIRFLKNIMGLWITQCLSKEWGISFKQMEADAKACDEFYIFDVNDARFLAPENMTEEIKACIGKPDATNPVIINSVLTSLANNYKCAIDEIEDCIGRSFEKLYIVGGGAKNLYLNELTEKYTGKKLIALPIEATAIGNILVQEKAYNDKI